MIGGFWSVCFVTVFQGSLLVIILFRAIIAWFASNFISALSYYCHLQEYSNVCLLPSRKIPLTIAILFAIFSFVLICGSSWATCSNVGHFPFRKKPGNFGGSKGGFSDWQKVVPFGRKPRKVAVPDHGPGTDTNYEKRVNGTQNSVRKFQPGKWAHLFRFFTFCGNFPMGRTDKTCSIYRPPEIPEMLTKWKVPITICIDWVPHPHSNDWQHKKTQNLFEVFKMCSAVQRI